MRRAGTRRRIATVVASLVVGLGLVAVVAGAPSPAAADIAAISPAQATVNAGASTTARVTVRSAAFTCVTITSDTEKVQASVPGGQECSDADEWSVTMTVHTVTDIEPGRYTVRVFDQQSGDEKPFTLVVRQPDPPPPPPTEPPPPPPPPPPTTTTTTTAPPTTANTAPAPPDTTPTTVAETTTTTAALTGDPFTPLAELVERPVPTEGVFLPLVGEGYRTCLPLTEPCGDPGSGLALLPARATEITWEPVPEGTVNAPATDLRGIAPLAAIGVGPAEPRSQNYALSVLDLTAPGRHLRTLLRGMDDLGGLTVVATRGQPVLRPVAAGPPLTEGSTAFAAAPFGRPTVRTASSFTEAAPAVPIFASVEPQVIYAIRPDNGWGLNLDLVPLFDGAVPLLVRGIEGPPGLFIARPPNLRVPQGDGPAAAPAQDADDGSSGLSPLTLLGGAVGLGLVATALARRRRSA